MGMGFDEDIHWELTESDLRKEFRNMGIPFVSDDEPDRCKDCGKILKRNPTKRKRCAKCHTINQNKYKKEPVKNGIILPLIDGKKILLKI